MPGVVTGRIVSNIVHFARLLRAAGVPAGPDRVLAAVDALELVGFDRGDDVHAALATVMLAGREQQAVFDAIFDAFWRDPDLFHRLTFVLPSAPNGQSDTAQPGARSRRAEQAMFPQASRAQMKLRRRIEAELSFSGQERLQRADFEGMSAREFELASRLAESLALPLRPLRTRRLAPASAGRIDLRRTLRRMARAPDTIALPRSAPRRVPPPLVILIDISGSMDRYARVFLHFAYGLTQHCRRVHTLVFGTRLTNVTRCLRDRDPDSAMARTDALVQDWRGGTRIGSSIAAFNRLWARRLLAGNAALLLITDGLERDEASLLACEAERLARFARQFVWLNPLLRFDGFSPRAAGVRALLPHVGRMLPMHNLASLADLAQSLRSVTSHSGDCFRLRQNPGYPG